MTEENRWVDGSLFIRRATVERGGWVKRHPPYETRQKGAVTAPLLRALGGQ